MVEIKFRLSPMECEVLREWLEKVETRQVFGEDHPYLVLFDRILAELAYALL